MVNRFLPRLVTLAMLAALGGCTWAPGPALDSSRIQDDLSAKTGTDVYPVKLITADVVRAQPDSIALAAAVPDSPARTGKLGDDLDGYEYLIGPQDLVGVTVLDHPEMSSGLLTAPVTGATAPVPGVPQVTPTGLPSDQSGYRVDRTGEMYYPPVGKLRVGGKTVDQVRAMITGAIKNTVRDPRVDVRVIAYRSKRVDVTGQVRTPGMLPVTDVPVTLVNAITRAGGFAPEADVQKVRLTRDGKLFEFDLEALIERRNGAHDFLLRGGDVVYVPDRLSSRIFVLGEVARPQSLLMNKGRLSLADALAGVNSIDVKAADPRQIFVIRGMRDKPQTPDVYRLDMTQVDAMLLSTQFRLEPLDVVYVGTSDAVRFNRVLDQITPTIQTLFFTVELAR
ncbi:polysaccharide export outer membrane protein [Cupriavidus sp. OV038]|uniref:polysaccharide biosynthesis/export family protein n=1 Tax=unclassified Cupriavidus TaxID=2640874 RepID=UPI0008E66691|nr:MULTISPECIES: polysaccharide biosynthesis/export family protein [unclassified Cupriavidus]SFC27770.1 polysaccharide export outer membrane protein [Cupriavidus sp. OV038]SFP20388.1 polysaccharide export outer membrane protein [Cupriavidus sp. OV096]